MIPFHRRFSLSEINLTSILKSNSGHAIVLLKILQSYLTSARKGSEFPATQIPLAGMPCPSPAAVCHLLFALKNHPPPKGVTCPGG